MGGRVKAEVSREMGSDGHALLGWRNGEEY
jgi:hypothetical protein